MATNKTAPTKASVKAYLDGISDEDVRRDAKRLDKILREVSGEKPIMWGAGIVGYGSYHYRYDSGREGDWARIGFSSRKSGLVLYLMDGYEGRAAKLKKIGKVKTGKSCLYLPPLSELDEVALRELLGASWAQMGELHPHE